MHIIMLLFFILPFLGALALQLFLLIRSRSRLVVALPPFASLIPFGVAVYFLQGVIRDTVRAGQVQVIFWGGMGAAVLIGCLAARALYKRWPKRFFNHRPR